MEVELALKEYGLSEKEIKVYLTLLPLGSVNLQEVSKRLEFPRTTVYNTLHYLAQKGLVSKIVKRKIMFLKKLLELALPELEGLKSIMKETSNIEIYEGNRGLFTILSDVFKVKQKVYYFGSYSLSREILKHQPEHFRTIRIEKKIPAKIVIDPYEEETFHKPEYKKITEMRFFKELKNFPCMIFIYGKKVALYTLKGELIGIIIENKQVADAMKMIFDVYWEMAKPSNI